MIKIKTNKGTYQIDLGNKNVTVGDQRYRIIENNQLKHDIKNADITWINTE